MTNHDLQDGGLDMTAVRMRLAAEHGPRFWRSLEELADTVEFQEYLHREFPTQASEWNDPGSRRTFLKLMGASLALAGVGGCAFQPEEKIVPYVRAPEEIVPGKPLMFASALTLGGYARGVLVESHMGRPTKVEGNPDHPASLGGTDPFLQAAVLSLYDPDRSQVITTGGQITTWDNFLIVISTELEAKRRNQGAGLRVLTETVTSPTLANQLEALLKLYPKAQWHQYEPTARDSARAGSRLAFGEDVETHYRIDKANVILTLDADFLGSGPGSLRYARDFASRREVRVGQTEMNRLYAVESTPTITGAMADHRLPLRASDVEGFARSLARELGVSFSPAGEGSPTGPQTRWMTALANDLKKSRGNSVILVGEEQPAAVHTLGHAMNQALGNVGQTVVPTAPVVARPIDQFESLRALVRDIDAGNVDLLVIVGGNPVYTAPADLNLMQSLTRVHLKVHLGLYEDETSAQSHWHIPEAHELESWGDARAYDGTVSIRQPLIAPLYGGKSAHELLAALLAQTDRTSYDIVRAFWQTQKLPGDFEKAWRTALHDGLIDQTKLPAKSVSLKEPLNLPESAPPQEPPKSSSLEIIFRADPTIWDGRFANNGWLQELPKPLTKLTWDNAALMSKATGDHLSLANEDVVELRYRDRTVRAPVWISPGHPDDSVTVHLGYGRSRAGRVGSRIGFNAYALRTTAAPWFDSGLEIQKTGERAKLATTQHWQLMEGRELVRAGTLEQFRSDPQFAHQKREEQEPPADLTLYPPHPNKGYAWGMAINLDTCIGCNACVVACQAENNIPVVGKEQVLRGRAMHWIRVDRYYASTEGDEPAQNPEVYHQPVPCMHCENAPCELVCPVAATVHDAEGVNNMVYNRCVGTRYCSNNCPYKVRRFNFLQYSDQTTPSLKLLNNPDVTVRTRGVMEKCTYCIQRINSARYKAEEEDRPIRDGEIVTACQSACPTRAIVFGNINDPNSHVSRLKAEPLNYAILAELNTRPRTTYLAKLRNPNPELANRETSVGPSAE
ncbi:MAG TPA: TAT-variant-translocated molybdopterin oxidoreductase [Isosphaeraceae bacterium]|jgi:molybdopterin-containing oxidoreductase family iron-sulfur binding subunit|nr:TAT-variant-translocated molybdopterin oxidoreductase [Isosphaeraceae bacterium]